MEEERLKVIKTLPNISCTEDTLIMALRYISIIEHHNNENSDSSSTFFTDLQKKDISYVELQITANQIALYLNLISLKDVFWQRTKQLEDIYSFFNSYKKEFFELFSPADPNFTTFAPLVAVTFFVGWALCIAEQREQQSTADSAQSEEQGKEEMIMDETKKENSVLNTSGNGEQEQNGAGFTVRSEKRKKDVLAALYGKCNGTNDHLCELLRVPQNENQKQHYEKVLSQLQKEYLQNLKSTEFNFMSVQLLRGLRYSLTLLNDSLTQPLWGEKVSITQQLSQQLQLQQQPQQQPQQPQQQQPQPHTPVKQKEKAEAKSYPTNTHNGIQFSRARHLRQWFLNLPPTPSLNATTETLETLKKLTDEYGSLLTAYLSEFVPKTLLPPFICAVTKLFYYLMYRIVTASPHERPPNMTVAPLPAAIYSIAAATMLEVAVGCDETSPCDCSNIAERVLREDESIAPKEQQKAVKILEQQPKKSNADTDSGCTKSNETADVKMEDSMKNATRVHNHEQRSNDQNCCIHGSNLAHNDSSCKSSSNAPDLSTTLEEISEDFSMENISKGSSRSMSIEEKIDNIPDDTEKAQPDCNVSPILKKKIEQVYSSANCSPDCSLRKTCQGSDASSNSNGHKHKNNEENFIPETLRFYLLNHAKDELEKRKQMMLASEQQQAAPVKISLFSPLLSSKTRSEYPGISTPHTPSSPLGMRSPRSPLAPCPQFRSPGLFSPLLKTPLPTRGPTIRSRCSAVEQARIRPRSFSSGFPPTMMCSPYLFHELLHNLKFTGYGTLMKALDQFIQLSFSPELDDFYSLLYDHLVSVIVWTADSPVHAAFHGITSIASNYIFRIVMNGHIPRKYAFKYTLVEWIFQQVLYTAKSRLQLLTARLKVQDLDEEMLHFVPLVLLAGVAKGVPLDTVLLSLIIIVLKMHRRHTSVNKIAAVYLGAGGIYEALYPPQLVRNGQSGDVVLYYYYVFVPCFYKIIEKEKKIESSKESLLEFANVTGPERFNLSSNIDLIIQEAQSNASTSAAPAASGHSAVKSTDNSPHTPKRQKIQRGYFSPLSPLSKMEVAKRVRETDLTPIKSRYELRHLDESQKEVSVTSPLRARNKTGLSPKRKTPKKPSIHSPVSKRPKLEKESTHISAADYKQYEDEVLDILTCGKSSTPKKETVHQAQLQPGEQDAKSTTLSENDKVVVDVLTQLSRTKFTDTAF